MKQRLTASGICGILFLILIFMVKTFDIAAIGPEGTMIGFSHLNQAVHETLGVHAFWYRVTEMFGLIAIAVAFLFAVVGLVQLIQRKSLLKIDREILLLGGLYVAVIGIYVIFEFVIINYRPILMPGCSEPEASFPSSHTMFVCVIMGSAAMLLKNYIYHSKLRTALRMMIWLFIAITVIGRLLSGVHWFTDILGGVILSAALLFFYGGLLKQQAG